MSKHALWSATWFWPSIFAHTTHADKRKSKAKDLLLIVPGGVATNSLPPIYQWGWKKVNI
jgi:hypothetical protein